jgi:hypothetical protein
MLSIVTMYHPATNFRGASVSARSAVGASLRAAVPWDFERSTAENHERAAGLLADRNGWGAHPIASAPSTRRAEYVHVVLVGQATGAA